MPNISDLSAFKDPRALIYLSRDLISGGFLLDKKVLASLEREALAKGGFPLKSVEQGNPGCGPQVLLRRGTFEILTKEKVR